MGFFQKNDLDTTRYVINSLLVTTLVGIIILILNMCGIFTIKQSIMNVTMPVGLFVMLTPVFLLKVVNIPMDSLKKLSMTCLILGIAIINCGMTYQSLLSWAIPILIASHYYSPRITKVTFISTAILMFVSMYIGLFWGAWDNNMMGSAEAVYGFQNRMEYMRIAAENGRNVMVYIIYIYYVPRMLILYGFYFMDITLSKRTHNLLLTQKNEYLEKENRNQELSVATQIQKSVLPNVFPPFPERNEFDIYATMSPSKEVGGDFYDFFLIDDDHLAIVIADVSDKGVPAAMFMMGAKIMIKNATHSNVSPAKVLEEVNNQLCENNDDNMFVTVWFGIYEISTGKIVACNAGHEYPVIKPKDKPFEPLKGKHGFVVGGMEGVKYKDYEIELNQGDTLFLYTDGVLDAIDSNGATYGMDRLVASLNSKPALSLDEMLQNVKSDVDTFAGGLDQFDDITMLAICRNAIK